MTSSIKLGNLTVGPNNPCFIIAEAGVNHNGDINLAHKLVDEAFKTKANAVKFQSFKASDLVSTTAAKAEYQINTTGANESQFEMLQKLELSLENMDQLKKHCEQLGIMFLCTPYDYESVAALQKLEVKAFKIASADIVHVPLLRQIAATKIPMILSTGMSDLEEVIEAVTLLNTSGAKGNFALLHCTSEYPASIPESNLKAILTLIEKFDCPIGFSDHTPETIASQLAVALGACIIEKHFTLDRSLQGPDHEASLDINGFQKLVGLIRETEEALGDGIKRPTTGADLNKQVMQRSLVADRDIRKGDKIVEHFITVKRPGTGLSPKLYDAVIGLTSTRDIHKGEVLTHDSLNWN
tara:strand:+ start:977 stop:2038 length:1062 start_codon:yes stop_codon:yes gene_type:complete